MGEQLLDNIMPLLHFTISVYSSNLAVAIKILKIPLQIFCLPVTGSLHSSVIISQTDDINHFFRILDNIIDQNSNKHSLAQNGLWQQILKYCGVLPEVKATLNKL